MEKISNLRLLIQNLLWIRECKSTVGLIEHLPVLNEIYMNPIKAIEFC